MRVSPRGVASLLLLLAACAAGGDAAADTSAARAAASAATPATAYAARATAVDTAPPPMDSGLASALARFRDALPRTDTLRHALPTKDAVVREFARLVERSDTTGLARLHLSRAEWAWIVYPESRYTRAPFRQRPDVGWMLIIQRSNTALARLLARRGGRPMQLTGWRCADTPETEGRTSYWGECTVTYRDADGAVVTERLFSSIVERDGRYKIGSYSNQF